MLINSRLKKWSLPAAGAIAAALILVTFFWFLIYNTPAYGQTLDTLALADKSKLVRQSPGSSPEALIEGSYTDFFLKDSYLFAVGDGLSIFDITDPAHPVYLGGLDGLPSFLIDVHVAGDYAYLPGLEPGLIDSGVYIVDISDPVHPALVRFYELTGANQVSVAGGSAFVTYAYGLGPTAFFGGLVVLDVSDPINPTQVSELDLPLVDKLVMEGDYAYVSLASCSRVGCTYWLAIIDVSAPANPASVADFGTYPYQITDFDEKSGLAALGVVDYELFQLEYAIQLYDISDPALPVMLGDFETPFIPESVLLHGHLAFVSGLDEIWVLDVSDATRPGYLGHYPYGAQEMQIVGDFLYIITPAGDIRILRYNQLSISGWVGQPNGMPAPDLAIMLNTGLVTGSFAGSYGFVGMPIGTYTLTLYIPGFTFYPLTRAVQLPPSAAGQNFTVLPEPVSFMVYPGMSNTLRYTDTQGLVTHLSAPTNTVTATTTLTVTPTLAPTGGGLFFTGHAFTLEAAVGGEVQPAFTFTAPLSVTVQLSAADLRVITDPAAVELYRWTGTGWQVVSETCGAAPVPIDSELRRSICQTGTYAVLGPTRHLLMPIILED